MTTRASNATSRRLLALPPLGVVASVIAMSVAGCRRDRDEIHIHEHDDHDRVHVIDRDDDVDVVHIEDRD